VCGLAGPLFCFLDGPAYTRFVMVWVCVVAVHAVRWSCALIHRLSNGAQETQCIARGAPFTLPSRDAC
jgi:hypothetical protein